MKPTDCHSGEMHKNGAGAALTLTHIASFPGLRVLAWDGDWLYASRGYSLLRAQPERFQWEPVAQYHPAWWRHLSAASRLGSRLFRDGFHALAALPSGHLTAAVPGAIVRLAPGETEFRVTHQVIRGTRPLHLTATPEGHVFWGEYFDNPQRDEVHIYASTDSGSSWSVAYSFPPGSIRHVHNIVFDKWERCLWVLTGDEGNECRILKASLDFKTVQTVLSGTQQTRAVALVPALEAVYFSSDTPQEANHVYRLDRRGNLSTQAAISSSSIYGCRVGEAVFFSTMVEPSAVNSDRHARIYGSLDHKDWRPLLQWKKDPWSMRFFQFGNAFLPNGENDSGVLALSTIAVEAADLRTSLWKINQSPVL